MFFKKSSWNFLLWLCHLQRAWAFSICCKIFSSRNFKSPRNLSADGQESWVFPAHLARHCLHEGCVIQLRNRSNASLGVCSVQRGPCSRAEQASRLAGNRTTHLLASRDRNESRLGGVLPQVGSHILMEVVTWDQASLELDELAVC